jgi:hypothetical protein
MPLTFAVMTAVSGQVLHVREAIAAARTVQRGRTLQHRGIDQGAVRPAAVLLRHRRMIEGRAGYPIRTV